MSETNNISKTEANKYLEAEEEKTIDELTKEALILFKKRNYKKALENYIKIRDEFDVCDMKILSNICICYLKLKKYVEVEKSCNVFFNQLPLTPNKDSGYKNLIVKNLMRRCNARIKLGMLLNASIDAKAGLKLDPTNNEAENLLKTVLKLREKALMNTLSLD